MPQNGKCVWVERPAAPGVTPIYCRKPTRYKMVDHEDGTKYREYSHLCPEHEAEAAKFPDNDDA